MNNAARRLSAFGTRFARSGLRFARGGLRFSGRRRYAESVLRVAVVVLVGATIAYGCYLAVGLFVAFVAYITPYLLVFLAVAISLSVGWFLLLAGNTTVSIDRKPVSPDPKPDPLFVKWFAGIDAKGEKWEADRKAKKEREAAEWKAYQERLRNEVGKAPKSK
jgi:hypothetical protein